MPRKQAAPTKPAPRKRTKTAAGQGQPLPPPQPPPGPAASHEPPAPPRELDPLEAERERTLKMFQLTNHPLWDEMVGVYASTKVQENYAIALDRTKPIQERDHASILVEVWSEVMNWKPNTAKAMEYYQQLQLEHDMPDVGPKLDDQWFANQG